MKNNNLNNSYNISVYAEGPNPSARDIQNLCAMFEVATFVSTINLYQDQEDFNFWEINNKYDKFIKEKYSIYSDSKSFDRLSDLVLASLVKVPYNQKDYDSEINSRKYHYLDEEIHMLRRDLHSNYHQKEKSSLSEGADFEDFNEWLTSDFGNKLIDISEINTKNSIEIIFNIFSMAAILGFQDMPAVKDSVLYIESVFKNWISKGKLSGNNHKIELPRLPKSLERTISKYDEIEISNTNDGWSIKLKRNS